MDSSRKQMILTHIYRVFDNIVHDRPLACKRYCASCCTRNVTLTTLEARLIVEYMVSHNLTHLVERLTAASGKKRFHPKTTTNGIALSCINGQDIPAEEMDESGESCPLLTDEECSIYDVRPFGCRCMISTHPCLEFGYAEIDPFYLTVNTVFMQYIEHLDAEDYSGNLIDVVQFLSSGQNPTDLIRNHPIPSLMIPPKHRSKMASIIDSIKTIGS